MSYFTKQVKKVLLSFGNKIFRSRPLTLQKLKCISEIRHLVSDPTLIEALEVAKAYGEWRISKGELNQMWFKVRDITDSLHRRYHYTWDQEIEYEKKLCDCQELVRSTKEEYEKALRLLNDVSSEFQKSKNAQDPLYFSCIAAAQRELELKDSLNKRCLELKELKQSGNPEIGTLGSQVKWLIARSIWNTLDTDEKVEKVRWNIQRINENLAKIKVLKKNEN